MYKKDKGITIVALVITIVLILIIAGISIGGTISGKSKTQEAVKQSELKMVQHAILERYTKSQLTKETLPGNKLTEAELAGEVSSINSEVINNEDKIALKENPVIVTSGETENYTENYYGLKLSDLEKLDITIQNTNNIEETEYIYIVNYKTGEAINIKDKVTESGKPLYVY